MVDLKHIKTVSAKSLHDLSLSQPLFLIFLRHFGCVFCQEALHDLAKRYPTLEKFNLKLVVAHMSSPDQANAFFLKNDIGECEQISDPECQVYKTFGLVKGNFSQLFGLQTWVRGYELKKKGYQVSLTAIGDSFQMPGIFIIKDGEIINSYIHQKASDKPDYDSLMASCTL